MKYFILKIVTLLLIFSCSACQYIKPKEETNKNNNESSETIKKKYTGEKKIYWDNKVLKASIQYVDGMREGINKNYSRSGKLISIVPFSHNKINGESKQFYPDGQLHSTINYINDVKQGPEKWYYENGNLYQESNYLHGKIDGIRKKYYKNGKIMSEAPYKYGEPGLGLKEYREDGSMIKFPKISVEEIDNLQSTGEYIIKYRLNRNIYNTKFYAGDLEKNGYFSRRLSPIESINGVGKSVIRLDKGSFMMYTVNVIAIGKTKFRNEYVTQKKINIAIENR